MRTAFCWSSGCRVVENMITISRAAQPTSNWDESRHGTVQEILDDWVPEPSPNGYDAEHYAYLRTTNTTQRTFIERNLMECPAEVFSVISKKAGRGHKKVLYDLLKTFLMQGNRQDEKLYDCLAFVPLIHQHGITTTLRIAKLILLMRGEFKEVPLVSNFNESPVHVRERIAALLCTYDGVARSRLIEKMAVSPITFDRNGLTRFILDSPHDADEITRLIIDHETLNVGTIEYLLENDGHASLGSGAI